MFSVLYIYDFLLKIKDYNLFNHLDLLYLTSQRFPLIDPLHFKRHSGEGHMPDSKIQFLFLAHIDFSFRKWLGEKS